MQHIRAALLRGPHGVLELRAGLSAEEAGALPVVLSDLARAGEIAALGHSVYARVPWMPMSRPVRTSPVEDLVFAALTYQETPVSIAVWLGLPLDTVRSALAALEQAGLVEERDDPTRRNHYRILSSRMAGHVRRGAVDRVFADVANHP